jgi:DHA2 family multidrug resistance protein
MNMGCIMMDIISKTYYFPSLTNYLETSFGISIQTSSLFFVFYIVLYFLPLGHLDYITSKIGNNITLAIGLLVIVIASIMTASPILAVIIIGFFISGLSSAFVYVPAVMNSLELLKGQYGEEQSNDIGTSIFTLGVNLGESFGPPVGGFLTEAYGFPISSYFIAFIALIWSIIFFVYNYGVLWKEFDERVRGLNIVVNEKTVTLLNEEDKNHLIEH